MKPKYGTYSKGRKKGGLVFLKSQIEKSPTEKPYKIKTYLYRSSKSQVVCLIVDPIGNPSAKVAAYVGYRNVGYFKTKEGALRFLEKHVGV